MTLNSMITVKRIQIQDIEASRKLLELLGRDFNKKSLEIFLSNDWNYLLIGYVDSQMGGFVIGYILDRFDNEGTMMFIWEVEVLPPFQKKGIGTAMIKNLKQLAIEKNIHKMWVLTNKNNQGGISLYKNMGGIEPNKDDLMFEFKF